MNGCDPYRNFTDNTCSMPFPHSIIQHEYLSRLSSTPLSITCLKLAFACQQE